jgi:hypothetical protein
MTAALAGANRAIVPSTRKREFGRSAERELGMRA